MVHDAEILIACMIAFGAVFVLLTCLAITMRVLVALFPQQEELIDTAVVAAISTTFATLIPGARVTRIEEE